jgi:Fic family protein
MAWLCSGRWERLARVGKAFRPKVQEISIFGIEDLRKQGMPDRLPHLIHEITRLKAELDALQPMPREAEDKLWKKLRMEWNYNSNHIEGNTLTYSETEALIYFDRTSGDHTLQEYEEMRAHDVAIALVKEWAADKSFRITQSHIRLLNRVILVRPFWKDAMTPDGKPSRKLIEVGEYKSYPNSVRTSTGEMFLYDSPEETPGRMGELMDWYLNESSDLPPVSIAAEVHYRFIRIHPFDDGNGRVARLLVNYILMLHGFPPIVVESAGKDKYRAALQKADAGDVLAFHAFLAERQIASLELALKAARGERIDEPGDALKRLELLKRQLKQVDEEQTIQLRFSNAVVFDIAQGWWKTLASKTTEFASTIEEMFSSSRVHLTIGRSHFPSMTFSHFEIDDSIRDAWKFSLEREEMYSYDTKLRIKFEFATFIKGGLKTFGLGNYVEVVFTETMFQVSTNCFHPESGSRQQTVLAEKLLHQTLTEEDVSSIANQFFKSLVDEIEYRIKENGILP